MRVPTLLALAGAAGALLAAREVRACSVCGCGDPLVDASDSVPRQTRLRLALDLEWLSASAAMEGAAGQETVTQQTVRPVVVYSPVEQLNLVVQLPLVRKAWSMTGVAPASATETGLGDLDLGARWFFLEVRSMAEMRRQALGVSAGTTLPTGASDAAGPMGERLDDHAQLGTGSVGPYAGVVYAFHQDPWNVFASVTARAHTENGHGYRYGSALQWTARLDYRAAEAVALEAGVEGRYAWHDLQDGQHVMNTGGLVLAAAPGVAVNVGGDVWLRGRVQVPFLTQLDGEQSVGVTFFASAQLVVR